MYALRYIVNTDLTLILIDILVFRKVENEALKCRMCLHPHQNGLNKVRSRQLQGFPRALQKKNRNSPRWRFFMGKFFGRIWAEDGHTRNSIRTVFG